MLSEFISLDRAEILALTRKKVAVRTAPRATTSESKRAFLCS
jgi:hypothetical protein